jgi:hypothetical protein
VDVLPAARLHLRLAALLAPAGASVEGAMTRLRFSNAEIRTACGLIEALAVAFPVAGEAVGARRWLRDVQPERAGDTLRLHFARARAKDAGTAERAALADLGRQVRLIRRRRDPVTLAELAIDGNDLKALGLRPGPDFSRILERCLDAVIEDPALNRREALLEQARQSLKG